MAHLSPAGRRLADSGAGVPGVRGAQCVRQDFYAKIFAMNLTAILVWVAQVIADRLHQTRRHAYRVNFANAPPRPTFGIRTRQGVEVFLGL